MTRLCLKGIELIWKQCNSTLYDEGERSIKEAFLYGDKDSKYYLGLLYSVPEGPMGYNPDKARRFFLDAAEDGCPMAFLGAVVSGCYGEEFKPQKSADTDSEAAAAKAMMTVDEALHKTMELAEMEDGFAAWQTARFLDYAAEAFDKGAELPLSEKETAAVTADAADRKGIIHYYELAADSGIVEAIVTLGRCYERGRLVEADAEKAFDYACRAAELGHVWGLKKLGKEARLAGDEEAALQYFRAASIQGDGDTPFITAKMYLNGIGGDRDIEEAVRFLEMAAEREDERSYIELGDLFYQDQYIEKDNERAYYWYEKAYVSGEQRAAGPLGRLMLLSGPNQDIERGYELLREAAEKRELDPDGAFCLVLGNYYRDGEDSKLKEEAIYWYDKGAHRENPECMEILGNIFFHGEEAADADYRKSFYWFSKCEEAGTLQSPASLAYLYAKGEGCEINEEKAIELFERAALTDKTGDALYELGFVYENRGLKGDLDKAQRYYEDAVNKGNENALRRLSHFKRTIFGKWKVV